MVEWTSRWVWWLCSRLSVTIVCMVVVQSVLHNEGYFVAFKTLAVGAAALIVGVRVWMRGPRPPKQKPELSWGGKAE